MTHLLIFAVIFLAACTPEKGEDYRLANGTVIHQCKWWGDRCGAMFTCANGETYECQTNFVRVK